MSTTIYPGNAAEYHSFEGARGRQGRIIAVAGASVGALLVAGVALVGTSGTSDDHQVPALAGAHQGMVTGTVWVANEAGGSITAIDAATNTVAATVSGIDGPHNVQVSPDGTAVWTVSGHDRYAAMLAPGPWS